MNRYQDINGEQLQALLQSAQALTVVDVREPNEFSRGHIPGALLRPLGKIDQWSTEFTTESPLVLVCASGGRSSYAVQILSQKGFSALYNLNGGMGRWVYAISKEENTAK